MTPLENCFLALKQLSINSPEFNTKLTKVLDFVDFRNQTLHYILGVKDLSLTASAASVR